MNEEAARAWLAARYPAPALRQLERFADLLRAEAERQSLIARSTLEVLWRRHIVDSAQLVELAPGEGAWLDVGSGGGLPGIVVAILRPEPIQMAEPRRKRVEFLDHVIATLNLGNATTLLGKAQSVDSYSAVVSARAVAPMPEIFAWTKQAVSRETQYLLPRGQSWSSELEIAQHAWQGVFHVEQSQTDPLSGIVIASEVALR